MNLLFQSVALYVLIGCVSRFRIATAYLNTEQWDPSLLPKQLLRQMAQQFTDTR
jgi:hypothetical protein